MFNCYITVGGKNYYLSEINYEQKLLRYFGDPKKAIKLSSTEIDNLRSDPDYKFNNFTAVPVN